MLDKRFLDICIFYYTFVDFGKLYSQTGILKKVRSLTSTAGCGIVT